ncbi:MAG: MarR family transcriptional regulator [Ornithinimicrobium sp.]
MEIETERAAVDWLDDDEQLAWRAWLRGYRLVMQALEEGLSGTGLRLGEYEILAMLSEAPDHVLRMSALADLVVQSRSRLTHTAKRLEAMGLARRAKSVSDGRGVEVALTPQGYELVLRVAPVHLRTVRDTFVGQLSRDELLSLGEGMRRLIVTLRTRPEQGSDAV